MWYLKTGFKKKASVQTHSFTQTLHGSHFCYTMPLHVVCFVSKTLIDDKWIQKQTNKCISKWHQGKQISKFRVYVNFQWVCPSYCHICIVPIPIRLPACVNADPSGDKLGKQFNMCVNIWNNGIQTKALLSMKRQSGILIHYADCCRNKANLFAIDYFHSLFWIGTLIFR